MEMIPVVAIVFVALAFLYSAIRILREYERGVVFTLGRYTGTKGPGLFLLVPLVQQMVRIDLRVVVDEVPPQDVISRDNVSVKVHAVIYFRVVDPELPRLIADGCARVADKWECHSDELYTVRR